jgi:hypothetical protein
MKRAVSNEIRWFTIPPGDQQKIERWFANLNPPRKIADNDVYSRQDYYLLLDGVENLGIKLREPKKVAETGKLKTALEIKRQISGSREWKLNSNTGYANKWEKFSYDLAEGGDSLLWLNAALPASDTNWVKVDKERILAKYDADINSIVNENERPKEGCGVELTKIRISGKVYYSFGMEAFSESGKQIDTNFTKCAELIFNDLNLAGFKFEDSLSYPEFFARRLGSQVA